VLKFKNLGAVLKTSVLGGATDCLRSQPYCLCETCEDENDQTEVKTLTMTE